MRLNKTLHSTHVETLLIPSDVKLIAICRSLCRLTSTEGDNVDCKTQISYVAEPLLETHCVPEVSMYCNKSAKLLTHNRTSLQGPFSRVHVVIGPTAPEIY